MLIIAKIVQLKKLVAGLIDNVLESKIVKQKGMKIHNKFKKYVVQYLNTEVLNPQWNSMYGFHIETTTTKPERLPKRTPLNPKYIPPIIPIPSNNIHSIIGDQTSQKRPNPLLKSSTKPLTELMNVEAISIMTVGFSNKYSGPSHNIMNGSINIYIGIQMRPAMKNFKLNNSQKVFKLF